VSIPTISVAMSVFNAGSHLGEAIGKRARPELPRFEFLIVNDGSSDGSGAVIDRYAAADARIRAIHQPKCRADREPEPAAGRSARAADRAHGRRRHRPPARFERQLAFLAEHPDHGVVGTWAFDISEDGSPYAESFRDQPTSTKRWWRSSRLGRIWSTRRS
jgi:GT2 family glycosyltransferase